MEATVKNKKVFSLYFYYTVFFAIAAAICFSFFAIHKKSFVWAGDGLYNYYNNFIYCGKWIRSIVKEVLFNQTFDIPMWEWGFGPGADIISKGVFGNPFYLISAIFPEKFAEIGYNFMVILRLYLTGIAFCTYCKKMNCIKWTTVCAAIIYTFSGFALVYAPRHPFFADSMIWLPLILTGCEKIFRNESFVLFTLSVALCAFSGFYFFYMIVLLTILYVILRVVFNPDYMHLKFICNKIGKLLVFSIIGVAISCVTFLPVVIDFVENNTRVNDTYTYNFWYTANQYSALPGNFVNATAAVGLIPMAYIGVFGSFINHDKKRRWARIYLLAEIVFLCFPVFGSVFNGFGYVSDRWTFVWSFIPAYLFAKEFPNVLKFDIRKKGFLCLSCMTYTVVCLCPDKSRTEANTIGIVLLLIALVAAIFLPEIKTFVIRTANLKFEISTQRITQLVTVALIFSSVFHMAYYIYSEKERYDIRIFRDSNAVNSILSDEYASVWKLIDDSGFYRIDTATYEFQPYNYSFASHQPTTTSYWSVNSKEYVQWRQVNSAYTYSNYKFSGLSCRAWLTPQYCAKYFVASTAAGISSVPYGYEYKGKTQGYSREYYLYETENILPFGCTYDSVMKESDYMSLSFSERQQAALQSCIISDDIQTKLKEDAPDYSDFELDYELKCGKNVTFEDNVLHVAKNDSTVTLNFNGKTKGELYLLFSGFNLKSSSSSAEIIASCADVPTKVTHFTEYDKYSEGRTEYLLNLGYSEDERNKITVKFSKKGDYSFDELKVICQPMEKLSEYVKARSENSLENVEFTTNKISGTIDLEESKLLCLSLPYSKGWTAYVDGERADLLNTNIAFSGLMLEPGHHEIKLTYCTPYIKIGALLSVLGLICIIVGGIMFKHKEWVVNKINSLKKRIKNIKVSDSDQD
ncbi:MAG: YfhO family protein [Ruminococcaceae bacterium]|nr:YfhO family protein [Oscillospiraceae bacterium]